MRKTLILIVATLLVAACNTVAGAGRDIQAAGRAVSGTADDARR